PVRARPSPLRHDRAGGRAGLLRGLASRRRGFRDGPRGLRALRAAGGRGVSAAAVEAAGVPETAASPGAFTRRAVITMVVLGALSFCAFIVLSAYAPDLRSGSDGRSHALSKSAVGFAGAAALLRARELPVVIRRGRDREGNDGLLVVTPETRMSEAL